MNRFKCPNCELLVRLERNLRLIDADKKLIILLCPLCKNNFNVELPKVLNLTEPLVFLEEEDI